VNPILRNRYDESKRNGINKRFRFKVWCIRTFGFVVGFIKGK